MLLELAIWKWKITEQFHWNSGSLVVDMRMRRRTDSVTAVTIIVPNVFSFLTDGNNGNGDCNIWVDIFVSINSVDGDDDSLPSENYDSLDDFEEEDSDGDDWDEGDENGGEDMNDDV